MKFSIDLNLKNFKASKLSTYDFSVLYITVPHHLIKDKRIDLINRTLFKAFDRMWHVGLLLKLKSAGVAENVLTWFKGYLFDRRQRVVLPGANSNWTFIRAGVPKGQYWVLYYSCFT